MASWRLWHVMTVIAGLAVALALARALSLLAGLFLLASGGCGVGLSAMAIRYPTPVLSRQADPAGFRANLVRFVAEWSLGVAFVVASLAFLTAVCLSPAYDFWR